LAVFYERGILQARLATNYKGANIVSYGDSADEDEYFDENLTMDANLSIKLSKSIVMFGEANNLLNTRFRYYYGIPSRPTQVEYYGIRGQLGFRFNL